MRLRGSGQDRRDMTRRRHSGELSALKNWDEREDWEGMPRRFCTDAYDPKMKRSTAGDLSVAHASDAAGHQLANPLPERGAPLDVGEEEGDGAAW